MANFRQVHTKIWKDGWYIDQPPDHKLLFIYLFTNESASISGLYELPKRVMAFETGLTSGQVDNALYAFEEADKIRYEDGVVWVVNMRKYHKSNSPKVLTRIKTDIDMVKDCELKHICAGLYGIDMVSEEENRVSIPPSTSTSNINSKDKPPSLPVDFAAPDMLNEWGEWNQYHVERGKPITKSTAILQFKKFKEWGEARSIAAMQHSRGNNYTGLFEPKDNYRGRADLKPHIDEIKRYVKQYGSRQAPTFNGTTEKLVKLSGGYNAICKMTLYEMDRALSDASKEIPA